jgi:hypothetical protein
MALNLSSFASILDFGYYSGFGGDIIFKGELLLSSKGGVLN